MKTISDQLKTAIKRSGKTKYALAQESGVAWAQISRFMDGERDLRLESAARLAESLNLKLTGKK